MVDRPEESSPERPASGARKGGSDETAGWHRLTGLGVEFIVAVVLFGALGWWLDKLTGWRPWLLIAGFGFGFAVGLGILYRAGSKSFR